MQLQVKDDLPFTNARIVFRGSKINVENVLVDIGSAATLFASDVVAAVQITPQPEDQLYTIRGVGGSEVVFTRQIDGLQVGECTVLDFEVEIAGMDYGFEINGILGMDFLRQAGAILNLHKMTIDFVLTQSR